MFGSTMFGSTVFAGMGGATTTPVAPFTVGFRLEVDWDDDGFLSPYADISPDVIGPVSTQRGRDYASQLTGRSVAGALSCTLRNGDGRYSSFNAASPLYGVVRPGLKVRAWATAPLTAVLWTGQLDSILPRAAAGGEATASLQAAGAFKALGDQARLCKVPAQVDVLTGDVVDAVLDSADWPAAARNLEQGVVPVRFYTPPAGMIALEALQAMEEAELGFAYEGLDFDVVYEGRYHRLLNRGVSQASLSDDVASGYPYMQVEQEDTVRNIYNRAAATVTPHEVQPSAVLWSVDRTDSPYYLGPGDVLTLEAQYSGGFVSAWGAISVTSSGATPTVAVVETAATSLKFSLTNPSASLGAELSLVEVSGVAYAEQQSGEIEAIDAASQAKYGPRSYQLASPWHINAAYALAACQYFVSQAKDPQPVITLSIPAGADANIAEKAETLALSDRITLEANGGLTQLGINQDFFIESIEHSFGGAGEFWQTRFTLSPADVGGAVGTAGGYWLLGDAVYGVLDTTTRLAF